MDEIQSAVPLLSRPAISPNGSILRTEPLRFNRMALAAFVTALAGIPFFGAVTGLAAILLGSLALGSLRGSSQRGLGFAITGILLGLTDVVGWIILLSVVLTRPFQVVPVEEFQNDPAALNNLDPVHRRAMQATVMVEADGQGLLAGRVAGSGVVLSASKGEAIVVTNRHVVDANFPRDGGEVEALPAVQVYLLGQQPLAGKVVWLAPDGVDLALVRVSGDMSQVQAALWEPDRPLKIGDTVFAIGNPHRLSWTHTQGVVSQFRRKIMGSREIRIVQTQTALNPGNSGGGLFDLDGYLIGINTWTNDKRISEGISFAICFSSFFQLHPPGLPRPRAAAASAVPSPE
jgi:S1-C subfamily serine protease